MEDKNKLNRIVNTKLTVIYREYASGRIECFFRFCEGDDELTQFKTKPEFGDTDILEGLQALYQALPQLIQIAHDKGITTVEKATSFAMGMFNRVRMVRGVDPMDMEGDTISKIVGKDGQKLKVVKEDERKD